MTISRRSFLRTMFAAAAAGALLTDSKVAQAISAFPEDRVSVLVGQARALVALADTYKSEYAKPAWTKSAGETICREQTDAFFASINRFYPDEMKALDEAQFLMQGLITIDLMNDATIARINPEIVPLALVREVVKDNGVRRCVKINAGAFKTFAKNHQKAVFFDSTSVAAESVITAFQSIRFTITESGRTLLLSRYYAARDAGKLHQAVDFSGDDYKMYTSQEMV